MQRLTRLILAGIVAGLTACSGTHERRQEQAAAVPGPPQVVAVLDVPALLGLSIDALDRRLGARQALPAGFIDPIMQPLLLRGEPLDSMALYRYRSLALLATYDHRSRRVRDLLLLGSDEDALMQRARLNATSGRYLLMPVYQLQRPTELMGLRVVPSEYQ